MPGGHPRATGQELAGIGQAFIGSWAAAFGYRAVIGKEPGRNSRVPGGRIEAIGRVSARNRAAAFRCWAGIFTERAEVRQGENMPL